MTGQITSVAVPSNRNQSGLGSLNKKTYLKIFAKAGWTLANTYLSDRFKRAIQYSTAGSRVLKNWSKYYSGHEQDFGDYLNSWLVLIACALMTLTPSAIFGWHIAAIALIVSLPLYAPMLYYTAKYFIGLAYEKGFDTLDSFKAKKIAEINTAMRPYLLAELGCKIFTVNVKDFSYDPKGRYPADGPDNGSDFFEKHLKHHLLNGSGIDLSFQSVYWPSTAWLEGALYPIAKMGIPLDELKIKINITDGGIDEYRFKLNKYEFWKIIEKGYEINSTDR